MPIVEVSIPDLERLSRTALSHEKILEILELMKGEVEELEGDKLVFEASHDRPDLFSAEGLGRSIGLITGSRKPHKYNVDAPGTFLDVSEAPAYRPYAFLAIVKNLELDDESLKQLFQLQEKLHITYCKDRELVSIGLYDLDKLKPPFRYVAVKDASYVPLGYAEEMTLEEILKNTDKGREYAHLVRRGNYPLLTDSEGQILSFPPILNAEYNKVTEETRNVVIDVTGTEPYLMLRVLNIVVTSVAERSTSPVIESVRIIGTREDTQIEETPQLLGKEITVSRHEIRRVLGFDIEIDEVTRILERMGFIASASGDEINVWIPPYRVDVHGVPDIVEDIAIGFGYNRIETYAPPPTHFGLKHPVERFSDVIRDVMSGLGMQEVVNFMMTDSEVLELVTDSKYVNVLNPKMKTYSAIRNSMLPSLLLAAKVNYERVNTLEIFEVGDVVEVRDTGEAESVRKVGFLLMGDGYTLTDGLVVVKSLIVTLGAEFATSKTSSKAYIEARAANVMANGIKVGEVGEVHPSILVSLGIRKPVVAGEIYLGRLREALFNPPGA